MVTIAATKTSKCMLIKPQGRHSFGYLGLGLVIVLECIMEKQDVKLVAHQLASTWDRSIVKLYGHGHSFGLRKSVSGIWCVMDQH